MRCYETKTPQSGAKGERKTTKERVKEIFSASMGGGEEGDEGAKGEMSGRGGSRKIRGWGRGGEGWKG